MKKMISLAGIVALCFLQAYIRYSNYTAQVDILMMVLLVAVFSLLLITLFGVDQTLWQHLRNHTTAEIAVIKKLLTCGTPLITGAILYNISFMFHVRNGAVNQQTIEVNLCVGIGLIAIGMIFSAGLACVLIAKKWNFIATGLFMLLAVWQWRFNYYQFLQEWQGYLVVAAVSVVAVILLYFTLGFVSLKAFHHEEETEFALGITAKSIKNQKSEPAFFLVPVIATLCLWGFAIFGFTVVQLSQAFQLAAIYTNMIVSLTIPVTGVVASWVVYQRTEKKL